MKDKMKGFTLVELLAVIIILAIVALVTTPAILNVINNSRLEGAKDKTWGAIDAVKLAYTQSQTIDNHDVVDNPKVTFTSKTADDSETVLGRKATMSGEHPSKGSISIDTTTGVITAKDLVFTGNGKYACTTNTDGTDVTCCKNSDSCTYKAS